MKLSRFYELLTEEFGEGFSQVVLNDTRLIEFQDRTPVQLIAQGVETREIWLAICRAQQVPKSRWHGVSQTKQHAEK